jgi:transcriptional regulator of acetoin/glycerol metabolism
LPPEFREPRIVGIQKQSAKRNPALDTEDEAAAIRQALEQNHGRAGLAANVLGMSRATFWRKRKALGL